MSPSQASLVHRCRRRRETNCLDLVLSSWQGRMRTQDLAFLGYLKIFRCPLLEEMESLKCLCGSCGEEAHFLLGPHSGREGCRLLQ